MKKILYGSVFCIWYLMSLLPLRVLYILSDGLFYLIYYVVKYRRPLVRKHLFDSFPKKNEAERIKIEKDAAEPEIIRTVWGKGYKFAEPHHDAPL